VPAEKFTRKANTPKKKRQWQHVYDSALKRGDSKGEAIRKASGVVKRGGRRSKRRRSRRG
jgi:hypothetical protein